MKLAEIAEMHRSIGVCQEWSELKNNQRLDFFVLLYQDKRTKKIFRFIIHETSSSYSFHRWPLQ